MVEFIAFVVFCLTTALIARVSSAETPPDGATEEKIFEIDGETFTASEIKQMQQDLLNNARWKASNSQEAQKIAEQRNQLIAERQALQEEKERLQAQLANLSSESDDPYEQSMRKILADELKRNLADTKKEIADLKMQIYMDQQERRKQQEAAETAQYKEGFVEIFALYPDFAKGQKGKELVQLIQNRLLESNEPITTDKIKATAAAIAKDYGLPRKDTSKPPEKTGRTLPAGVAPSPKGEVLSLRTGSVRQAVRAHIDSQGD